MQKYLKKPVEIEAALWDGTAEGATPIIDWILSAGERSARFRNGEDDVCIAIDTLEGTMKASPGDYIIKGVAGEFYPCKPDIFEATYQQGDISQISDGYHTFNELYEHRIALFIALALTKPQLSWRSKLHDDGSFYDDWFIAGMHLPTGDITYHLPMKDWDKLGGNRVAVATLERAPAFDGHTPADVVARLDAWMHDFSYRSDIR